MPTGVIGPVSAAELDGADDDAEDDAEADDEADDDADDDDDDDADDDDDDDDGADDDDDDELAGGAEEHAASTVAAIATLAISGIRDRWDMGCLLDEADESRAEGRRPRWGVVSLEQTGSRLEWAETRSPSSVEVGVVENSRRPAGLYGPPLGGTNVLMVNRNSALTRVGIWETYVHFQEDVIQWRESGTGHRTDAENRAVFDAAGLALIDARTSRCCAAGPRRTSRRSRHRWRQPVSTTYRAIGGRAVGWTAATGVGRHHVGPADSVDAARPAHHIPRHRLSDRASRARRPKATVTAELVEEVFGLK